MNRIVRGIVLVLFAAVLVLGSGTAAEAKTPKLISQAADTLKCTDMSSYDAEGPGIKGYQCFIKGKKLGYADQGRTFLMKFKSNKEARSFWKGWLADCHGDCWLMIKGKLVVGGGNYEKDIARYAGNKLDGKVYNY